MTSIIGSDSPLHVPNDALYVYTILSMRKTCRAVVRSHIIDWRTPQIAGGSRGIRKLSLNEAGIPELLPPGIEGIGLPQDGLRDTKTFH
jgi:hypothetical protein